MAALSVGVSFLLFVGFGSSTCVQCVQLWLLWCCFLVLTLWYMVIFVFPQRVVCELFSFGVSAIFVFVPHSWLVLLGLYIDFMGLGQSPPYFFLISSVFNIYSEKNTLKYIKIWEITYFNIVQTKPTKQVSKTQLETPQT